MAAPAAFGLIALGDGGSAAAANEGASPVAGHNSSMASSCSWLGVRSPQGSERRRKWADCEDDTPSDDDTGLHLVMRVAASGPQGMQVEARHDGQVTGPTLDDDDTPGIKAETTGPTIKKVATTEVGSDSRAQRKRRKPRLVNSPLAPAALLMNRKRALRAEVTSYCAMLYESAFWELGERTARRERRAQLKASFERDAARFQGRVPFATVGGEPGYKITIRNAASAVTHEVVFRRATTYGTLFNTVRQLFGHAPRNTPVSMRLWNEADPKHLIEARTDCRLHSELHNQTLCCVFYK